MTHFIIPLLRHFDHVRLRERAKYETILQLSIIEKEQIPNN